MILISLIHRFQIGVCYLCQTATGQLIIDVCACWVHFSIHSQKPTAYKHGVPIETN